MPSERAPKVLPAFPRTAIGTRSAPKAKKVRRREPVPVCSFSLIAPYKIGALDAASRTGRLIAEWDSDSRRLTIVVVEE